MAYFCNNTKNMAAHNQLGIEGENQAVAYLEARGYIIRERNWRSGRNELDIIAERANHLIFFEVKTRSTSNWGAPETAITTSKMRRMAQAAHHYIRLKHIDSPVQFDILSIVHQTDHWNIEHFEDAFLPMNIH